MATCLCACFVHRRPCRWSSRHRGGSGGSGVGARDPFGRWHSWQLLGRLLSVQASNLSRGAAVESSISNLLVLLTAVLLGPLAAMVVVRRRCWARFARHT